MQNVPVQLRDFRNFLFLVWLHLRLPEPTPIQFDMAAYLQHGPKRLVIEAFRGVGKSWITAAFVCWLLLMDPQCEVLVISASKQRADEFSTFTLRLIQEMDVLAHLRPDPNTQRVSRVAFDVAPHRASQAPSVRSAGITGQITGGRANYVILDDVEIPNNSATQTQRDLLLERIKEADAILKPEIGRVIYLGTPQSFESIYNKLEERGYELRIYPAEVPDERRLKSYGNRLAPMIRAMIDSGTAPGTPTDPRRFSAEDLAERRLSYGASGYALQFMLDTSLSDADRYPLKQSDLVVMSLDREHGPMRVVWGSGPQLALKDVPNFGFSGDHLHGPMAFGDDGAGLKFAPYTGSAMFVDPSGRGKDETAFAVVKNLHGQLFAVEVTGLRGGYDDLTLEKIGRAAVEHGVNVMLVEKNFGDGMFIELLKPVLARVGWKGKVEEVHSTGQKELRIIDTLEPLMNRHKLIIDKKVIEKDFKSIQELEAIHGREDDGSSQYSLLFQLTHITRDRRSLRHEDRLEALAGACAYWVGQVARDQDKALRDHASDALDKEIRKFVEKARMWHGPVTPRRPNALGLRRPRAI